MDNVLRITILSQSEYKIPTRKFDKEHFNLLVSITSLLLTYSNLVLSAPVAVKLGQKLALTHQIPRPYLKTSDENFYYVPFLKSLQIFLKR